MSYLIRMPSILGRRDTLVLCPASYSKQDAIAHVNACIKQAHETVDQVLAVEQARRAGIPGAGHVTVGEAEDKVLAQLHTLLSADNFIIAVPDKLPCTKTWNRRPE